MGLAAKPIALLASIAALGFFAQPTHAQNYQWQLQQRLTLVHNEIARGPFAENWNSLAGYRIPEWFRDAKFGIFIHWGVYSVPAFGNEWYPRNMYLQGTSAFHHQVETYGPQSKFGYKDFIPMFKAQKFDPDAWAALFRGAGARYVVPVAEHCDGFPMYDSDFTQWDAAKMGPRRDVIGELEKSVRSHGMYFGVSSHRAEHWWWYDGGMTFNSDVRNPKYAGLYGPAKPTALPSEPSTKSPDPNHLERWLPPDQPFMDDWLARSTELVDKYHPDLMYFDWWIDQPAFLPYRKRFAAYYYDRAVSWNRGVVLTYKSEAFPANTAVLDIERGRLDTLRLLPWQTDTSISVKSWGYIRNDTYRDAKSLIDELIDVVSKNGNLLLDVGPESDGTIPAKEQTVLFQMGRWLKVNGEAIYGTRPWKVYGEGPTKVVTGTFKDNVTDSFTARDIRYTSNGSILYAIALAWPVTGKIEMQTLWAGNPYVSGTIQSIRLLGSEQTLQWKQGPDALTIQLPRQKPNEIAYVFKIQTQATRARGECTSGAGCEDR